MKKRLLILLMQLPFLFAAQQAPHKIFLVGDSTVSTYRDNKAPMAGWGQMLQYFIGSDDYVVDNRAIGGRSSRSFIEEGRWDGVKADLTAGDFVFIQFGHNDRDYSKEERYTSPADYYNYIKQYVNETKALGATPVLVTPMVMNAWRNGALRNIFTESGAEYVQRMKQVATELNVPLIDLNQKSWDYVDEVGVNYATRFVFNTYVAGEYPNYPNGLNDYTHFQEMGALQMAKFVAEGIAELSNHNTVGAIADKLRPLHEINVTANYPDAGTITRSVSLPEGTKITLKTLTNNGHTFFNWKDGNNQTLTTDNKYFFTMPAYDVNYKAFFDDDLVVDCAGVSNGTAVLDQCGICTGGTTGKVACTNALQAEDFCSGEGILEASNGGFLGDGYFNQDNTSGASGLWTIVSETAQTIDLAIRYANGSGAARSMTANVNGAFQATFQGNSTNDWSSWKDETISITLQAGANTLELVSTSESGGPNIDLFSFTANGIVQGSCEQDCKGDFGGLAYLDDCTTCVGGTTGLEACEQDCNGEWGGSAFMDDCKRCVDGVSTLPCQSLLELEDACTIDGIVETTNAGFFGDAYANTDNEIGTGIDFKLNVTQSGTYSLWVNYANGSVNARSAKVIVNDVEQVASAVFAPTASWTTWDAQEIELTLSAGENTIRIEAITNEGAVNLDRVSATSDKVASQSCLITSLLVNTTSAGLTVSPNPSKGEFTLTVPQNTSYQVFTTSGEMVLQGNCDEQCVLGDELPKGLFIVRFNGSTDNELIKIIKE